ncbi:MAG TPA: hypothetical protein VF189_01205 [Patescibacteria group bacterium]
MDPAKPNVSSAQNSNPSVSDANVVQPINAQVVSGGAKEHSPIVSTPPQEFITPSTPEVQIPQELKEHMEKSPTPNIPQDAGASGVKLEKEETPVIISEDESLNLNTPPSTLAGIKQTKSIKDAVRWFAELIGLAQKKRDYEIAHPTDMAQQFTEKQTEKKEDAA